MLSPATFSILAPIVGVAAYTLLVGVFCAVKCCLQRRKQLNLSPSDESDSTAATLPHRTPLPLLVRSDEDSAPGTMESVAQASRHREPNSVA